MTHRQGARLRHEAGAPGTLEGRVRQRTARLEGMGTLDLIPTTMKWKFPTASLAAAGALLLFGCQSADESYIPTPGDPDKSARACQAVDEATPLAMSAADRRTCEATMRGWYAETWYSRPDPGDRFEGKAQLDYLRPKALGCRRAADAYSLTGEDRWMALMRCLVIVRAN